MTLKLYEILFYIRLIIFFINNVFQNKFQTFPADMLKSNVNMQKLLVDNNQITNLPDGFFNTLTLLQDFSMQNNKVTFLPGMTGPKKYKTYIEG